MISAPGVGTTLAAGILGRTGDLNRFANLAGVRASTGLVPKVDQSGTADRHGGPTKAGDPGLREALYLAADLARKVDPTLAARYRRLVVDEGKHHSSALCSVAPVLMTRIAACWRNGQRYELRDTEGAEGRRICAEKFAIPPEVRKARRQASKAKAQKGTSPATPHGPVLQQVPRAPPACLGGCDPWCRYDPLRVLVHRGRVAGVQAELLLRPGRARPPSAYAATSTPSTRPWFRHSR